MKQRLMLLICIIALCSSQLALAAENETAAALASLMGQVVDRESGEPLVGAVVQIVGTRSGGTTDENGRFRLEGVAAGPVQLRLSLLGYAEQVLEVGEHGDLGKITLAAKVIRLSEMVVTPGSYSVMSDGPMRSQTLGVAELSNMAFAEDITRSVSRLPGVASTDFSSKFTIRGGEDDEVLMTLDGMELYEPFHQRDFVGGLFSIVDIETVQGIELLTGGFSADYGDRQSGVFNMTTKKPDKRRTSFGLSPMNARVYTEGAFNDREGSYLFSARRGMLDKIATLAVVNGETTHLFYDTMGKVEIPVGRKHRLSLHVLGSVDRAETRDVSEEASDVSDTKYSNNYGWLRLKSFYADNLYAQTLLYSGWVTQDRFGDTFKDEPTDKTIFKLTDNRSYRFFGAKQDWVWDQSAKMSLKTGVNFKQLNADYDYVFNFDDVRANSAGEFINFHDEYVSSSSPSGQQFAAYLSTRFNPLPDLYLETGLRHDRATWTGDKLWSPRANIAYSFGPRTVLRGGWGRYYQSQFINNLAVHRKVEEFNPAELSTHYVVGLEHSFKNGIEARVDGYVKDITRISDGFQNLRDPAEVFSEARNDVAFIDFGDARAKGLEFFLKYDQGRKISWWFSYARARAEEQINNLQFEGLLVERTGSLRRLNNQDHTVYADVNYRPTRKWHINLAWQYYTGMPMTTYTYVGNHGYSDPPPADLHFAAAHNAFRGEDFPAYHKMDVRL